MNKTLTADRIHGLASHRSGFALYPDMSERTHRLCAALVADGHCTVETREMPATTETGTGLFDGVLPAWTLTILRAVPVAAAKAA